jgi:hypothetical protein
MTASATPDYPWYGVVMGDDLGQDDSLLNCPRFVVPPEALTSSAEHPVRVETVNAIVLTQSCDLVIRNDGRCEARDVMLCRVLFKAELASHPSFGKDAEWEKPARASLVTITS